MSMDRENSATESAFTKLVTIPHIRREAEKKKDQSCFARAQTSRTQLLADRIGDRWNCMGGAKASAYRTVLKVHYIHRPQSLRDHREDERSTNDVARQEESTTRKLVVIPLSVLAQHRGTLLHRD